jgi:hypothetical protein
MIENDVIDLGQERTAIRRRRLGQHAPGLGELGVQENAAKQAHNAQDIRKSVRQA